MFIDNTVRMNMGKVGMTQDSLFNSSKSNTGSPRNMKHNTTGNLETKRTTFDPTASKFQDVQSIMDARKLRVHRENEVKKLHNRIAVLQEEEEKALKRIEDTRAKAQAMLEFKIEQE